MKINIAGVRFKTGGKIYYFSSGSLALKTDDPVIVETSKGMDYGTIAAPPKEVEEETLEIAVRPILRKADEKDIAKHASYKDLEAQAHDVFIKQLRKHELAMKLIDVEYTFDGKKVIFYFTAENRVDFRELVKDLASALRVRIELRQIGVRDEARLFGTIGVCGRPCCCSQWLSDFVPVSIKMAKEQNLSLNSTKISGVCGRLLCCLTYEQAYYEEINKRMPRCGQLLKTLAGMGQVYKLKTLEEAVLVKVKNERDETEIKSFSLEELDKAAQEPEVIIKKIIPYEKQQREKPRRQPRNTAPEEAKDEQSTERAPRNQNRHNRNQPKGNPQQKRPQKNNGGRPNNNRGGSNRNKPASKPAKNEK